MSCETMKRPGETLKKLVGEINQSEKATYCVISTVWHSGKDKTVEEIKRLVVSQG